MAAWPELDELKQVLDSDPEFSGWDGDSGEEAGTRLTALLNAAIEHVKQETQDTEEPSYGLRQAALRLAELMALKPEVAAAVSGTGRGFATFTGDPAYQAYLFGERRAFGIG
jgi:hypothetical protein